MTSVVKAGRSKGRVGVPAVPIPAPELSDVEVDQAMIDLGLSKLRVGQMRSLRTLGQFVRDSGVVSTGRGMMLLGAGKLQQLGEKIDQELDENPVEQDLRVRMMNLSRECWSEVIEAGKVLHDSDESRQPSAVPTIRLPAPGQFVHASQNIQNAVIKNTTVHNTVHTNGNPVLQPISPRGNS
jgi:hypothetical protein